MKSFDERKKEYFQKLRKYSEILTKLIEEKKNEKIIEVLLDPQNEKELEFGNYYIMYVEDSIKISVNASCNNVIEINPEDSLYAEFLSDIIKAVYNNENIEKIKEISKKYENDPKLLAKMLFELIVITITNPEEIVKSIFLKCGVNFDDELEVMKFEILMKKASKQIQPEILPVNEEKINEFISFAKYYHNYCIQGTKDQNNLEVQEILLEMFKEEEKIEGYTRSRNINN